MKKILLGDEAIVQGALEAGVDFVTGYPGCPSAEIGEEFLKLGEKYGVYAEWSINEKIALESAVGASFSGLKSLVNMKSFGINVCADSLLPLAYTGTNAPMVIVVADDPSNHSSAQSEQDSRQYAFLSHIPMLEPSSPKECYTFTKLAFKISEKFKLPVILRITTRVAHQRMPVDIKEVKERKKQMGEFIKNPDQYSTLMPKTLEMKKELLKKIEKIKLFAETSEINVAEGKSSKLGIIASGVSYLYIKEALDILGLDLPILKLGFFYPLPEMKISRFLNGLEKVLVLEEIEGLLEKEIFKIMGKPLPDGRQAKAEILGKNLLSEIGEMDIEKTCHALAKLANRQYKKPIIKEKALPIRTPRLCEGCPYWYAFATIKKVAPKGTIFGGDIGCNMMAGLNPHNIQDYLFSMGSSLGISHGVKKSTNQKVISIIGDGTFFHSGIPALINSVYNKSNQLIMVLDNRITAMTGHQNNPGEILEIEEIARACGVKNIKVLDPINMKELEETIKDYLNKEETTMIVCKRICALLAKRSK